MGMGMRQLYRKKKDKKSRAAAVDALAEKNRLAREAVDKENQGLTEKFDADTKYRASLIDAQRGGLASTIMNLGGGAGDPDGPAVASQLVGLTARAGESGGDLVLNPYAPDDTNLWYKKAKLTDL